ncbi:sensor histidine kinase [Sphingobacterium detergens]|uniref:Histidine kinase n=1 Tax=Sphingobacterium detergens TaxID=1145106 RepID=A0A420ADX2_SPHD1|nr:histidine kinase [Sphingobacterium detergens]RKE42572.1 histidine kinase [Sphingobacterium detergens]
MRSEIIWGKWYTPYVRVIVHIVFWVLVFCMYYFTYRRLGGSYFWVLVAKELFVTTSLFYSVIWLVSKWIEKRKVLPILIFIVFSYIWWLNITYLTCDLLKDFELKEGSGIYKYVNFFIRDGYFGIYQLKKFPNAFPDFLTLVSVPLAPKLIRLLVAEGNKVLLLEKDQAELKLEKAKLGLKNSNLELDKASLERDNLKMELEILKSQISPHFLFNTLNSIYRLAEKGEAGTPNIIMKLSNMLRYMLYQTNDDKIFIAKEIQFLNDYLDLTQIRFGDSVNLNFNIAKIREPYRIVPLMLLPFIENAIKHGPDRSRADAWIDVSLTIEDGILRFLVANGVNKNSPAPSKGGIGLQNVKRRLELRYKDKYTLNVSDNLNSYSVILEIEL